MSSCPQCGEAVGSDAAFCTSCGTELEERGVGTGSQESAETTGTTTDSSSGTNHSTSSRTGGTYSTSRSGVKTTATDYQTVPKKLSFVAGVVAFLAGYAVTWIQTSGYAASLVEPLSKFNSGPETWQPVGWSFMAMHNATVEGTGSISGPLVNDPITSTLTSGTLPDQWLLLVPVVALVATGYYVAENGETGRTNATRAGASIVLGYFACVVALSVLSPWSVSTTANAHSYSFTVGPKLVESVGIAGLAYPIIFGAIGGTLSDR
jgi:hypothetical protein